MKNVSSFVSYANRIFAYIFQEKASIIADSFLFISALLSPLSSFSPWQNAGSFILSPTAEMPMSLYSVSDIVSIAALSTCFHVEIIVCQSLSQLYLFLIIILFHFSNLLPAYYFLVYNFLRACKLYSFLVFVTYCKAPLIMCHEKVKVIVIVIVGIEMERRIIDDPIK